MILTLSTKEYHQTGEEPQSSKPSSSLWTSSCCYLLGRSYSQALYTQHMPTHPKGSDSYIPKLKPCQSTFHLYVCLEAQAVPGVLLPHPGAAFPKSKFCLQGNYELWSCTEKSLLTAISPFPVSACSSLTHIQRTDLVTKCIIESHWHITSQLLVACCCSDQCFCKAVARIGPKTSRPCKGTHSTGIWVWLFPSFLSSLEQFVASVIFLSHISMF